MCSPDLGRRHLVLRQAVLVVDPRPPVVGEEVGRLAERAKRCVVLEHPRVDVLARSRPSAPGSPPGGTRRRSAATGGGRGGRPPRGAGEALRSPRTSTSRCARPISAVGTWFSARRYSS